MKKKLTKYQPGGIKSKTVIKSDDGNYRTVEKSSSSPSGYSQSSKIKRTIKGVVTGAPKPGKTAPLINPFGPDTKPLTPPTKKQPMAKKGGAIKKKK